MKANLQGREEDILTPLPLAIRLLKKRGPKQLEFLLEFMLRERKGWRGGQSEEEHRSLQENAHSYDSCSDHLTGRESGAETMRGSRTDGATPQQGLLSCVPL